MLDGYLIIEFEGSALYLSKDDYKYARTKNALKIRLKKKITDKQLSYFKSFNKQNVSVLGVVKEGKTNLFGATIIVDDIRIIEN